MKYDCFLYVHINFAKKPFSTIPAIENPLQSALYQKALFLIVVNSSPYTGKRWYSHLERQHTIFVVRIKFTSGYTNSFDIYKIYFFCPFCMKKLVRLNSMNTNYLSLKLSSFEELWIAIYADHYYQAIEYSDFETEEFCRQKNVMYLYGMNNQCEPNVILFQLILFAFGRNFSVIPYVNVYYDYDKIPQIIENKQYFGFEPPFDYSPPVLKHFKHPSIIYCFNLGRETIAETDMWTKYVPIDIWGLVILSFILFAILNTTSCSRRKITLTFISQNLLLFANSLLKLMGIILRQSWSHKWKLLGIFELLFSTFLSVYENAITVSVVVPLIPKPFSTTKELYMNNYTFLVQTVSFEKVNDWLSDKYNTVNHRKVLGVQHFNYFNEWLKTYFMDPSNEIKYAIVGHLSRHFQFRGVTFVKEKNDTCYQMFPTEEAFSPEPFYFTFMSAVASLLHEGVSLLQAAGFLRVFETSEEFRDNLLAINYARPLVAKYENTYEDLKNNVLKESMITLGNIESVLYVGVILILVASVSFLAEVCMSYYFDITQKVTLVTSLS